MSITLELRSIGVVGREAPRLKGVSLTLQPGERVALLGANGSGKSTLIAVINGSLAADEGQVIWAGLPPGRRRQRRAIGTLWQDLRLVEELNVQQNINAGALGQRSLGWALLNLLIPLETNHCRRILEAAGLPAEVLQTPVTRLSGGQRQRVAIARLLRQQPEVLLADEPLASLDPALIDELLTRLLLQTSAETVLISLHRPELIHRFDRVIGLRKGQLVLDLRPSDLQSSQLDALYSP